MLVGNFQFSINPKEVRGCELSVKEQIEPPPRSTKNIKWSTKRAQSKTWTLYYQLLNPVDAPT